LFLIFFFTSNVRVAAENSRVLMERFPKKSSYWLRRAAPYPPPALPMARFRRNLS
jgi:hypothetical protein